MYSKRAGISDVIIGKEFRFFSLRNGTLEKVPTQKEHAVAIGGIIESFIAYPGRSYAFLFLNTTIGQIARADADWILSVKDGYEYRGELKIIDRTPQD